VRPGGTIISKQNVKKMMTRIDPLQSYCLGCNHSVENGSQVMAKSGSAEGSNAYIWLVPERRMVMVVMANRNGADVSGLGKDLRKIILGTSSSKQADLVVRDFVRTAAPTFKDGKWEIPVRFEVANQGAGGASVQFVNSVQVGTKDRWTGFMDPLPKQDAKTVNATVKIPDPSKLLAGRTLELIAFADAPIAAADTSIPSYGRVDESNDNNNKATIEVKIPGGLGLAAETPNQPTASGAKAAKKRVASAGTAQAEKPADKPAKPKRASKFLPMP
jgi:hypothetical protein